MLIIPFLLSTLIHPRNVILQPFRRFTYVTGHSTALPPLHLRHMPFYNPSANLLNTDTLLIATWMCQKVFRWVNTWFWLWTSNQCTLLLGWVRYNSLSGRVQCSHRATAVSNVVTGPRPTISTPIYELLYEFKLPFRHFTWRAAHGQASTDQPLCFKMFIMASHQSVVNIKNMYIKIGLMVNYDFTEREDCLGTEMCNSRSLLFNTFPWQISK